MLHQALWPKKCGRWFCVGGDILLTYEATSWDKTDNTGQMTALGKRGRDYMLLLGISIALVSLKKNYKHNMIYEMPNCEEFPLLVTQSVEYD